MTLWTVNSWNRKLLISSVFFFFIVLRLLMWSMNCAVSCKISLWLLNWVNYWYNMLVKIMYNLKYWLISVSFLKAINLKEDVCNLLLLNTKDSGSISTKLGYILRLEEFIRILLRWFLALKFTYSKFHCRDLESKRAENCSSNLCHKRVVFPQKKLNTFVLIRKLQH